MRNESAVTNRNIAHAEASNVIGFVNGRKATPTNITGDNLTREELAMYLKYDMDKRDEEIAALNKKQDEMITSINGLTNTVVKITESLNILTESLSTLHGNYKIASNANHRLLKTISETIVASVDAAKAMSANIGNNTAEISTFNYIIFEHIFKQRTVIFLYLPKWSSRIDQHICFYLLTTCRHSKPAVIINIFHIIKHF